MGKENSNVNHDGGSLHQSMILIFINLFRAEDGFAVWCNHVTTSYFIIQKCNGATNVSDNYLLRSLKTLFLFTFIPSLRPKSLKCSIDLSSLLLYKTYGAFLSRLLTRISLVLELLILNLPHAKQLIERVFWASSEAHMCLKCHIIGLQQKVMVSFAMLKSSMTSCCTNS